MSLDTSLQAIFNIQTTVSLPASALSPNSSLGTLQTALIAQAGSAILTTVTPGIVGPRGPTGAGALEPIDFSFGDASPRVVLTLQEGMEILSVALRVSEPFDGSAPEVRLGIAGDLGGLFDFWQADLSRIDNFQAEPRRFLAVGTQVILSLSPGLGTVQGRGRFVVSAVPAT